MSPLYEYRCATCARTETRLRKFERRFDGPSCTCGMDMTWMFPVPHIEPDGIYSYAPNIGTSEAWERKQAKIRERKQREEERRG
jgi:hypothetical protein